MPPVVRRSTGPHASLVARLSHAHTLSLSLSLISLARRSLVTVIGTLRIYGAYRKIQYRFVFGAPLDEVPWHDVRTSGKPIGEFSSPRFSRVFRVDRRDLERRCPRELPIELSHGRIHENTRENVKKWYMLGHGIPYGGSKRDVTA